MLSTSTPCPSLTSAQHAVDVVNLVTLFRRRSAMSPFCAAHMLGQSQSQSQSQSQAPGTESATKSQAQGRRVVDVAERIIREQREKRATRRQTNKSRVA